MESVILGNWRNWPTGAAKSKEEIKASLQATWDDDHLFIMKQCDDLYHYYKDLIKDTEAKIEELVNKYSARVDKDKIADMNRARSRNNCTTMSALTLSSMLTTSRVST